MIMAKHACPIFKYLHKQTYGYVASSCHRVSVCKVITRRQSVWGVLAFCLNGIVDKLLVQADRPCKVPAYTVYACEIVMRSHGLGMVTSQRFDSDFERLFEQSYGFIDMPCSLVCFCEVIGIDESVGMSFPQNADAIGQKLFVKFGWAVS